jgi:alkanesulfonate monooxygenase SsuD/methylene tetrahydromethanopterin reductase-like flavin-dependent oxidoreductase (luciferase family)
MDDEVTGIQFVGTAESVAGEMTDAMAEIGGDGFLFTEPLSRKTIAEITDGLVPALQRRGAARRSYARKTLRETLQEF